MQACTALSWSVQKLAAREAEKQQTLALCAAVVCFKDGEAYMNEQTQIPAHLAKRSGLLQGLCDADGQLVTLPLTCKAVSTWMQAGDRGSVDWTKSARQRDVSAAIANLKVRNRNAYLK